MSSYKLYYFNAKGKTECTRWLFALGDLKFEDCRLQGEEWAKLKPSTPFGQMPVLEVDGKMIAQSAAIARFIAKRTGLYGKDDIEQATVDMVAHGMDDMVNAWIPTRLEKDETRKAALTKKWEEEQKPAFLDNFERLLKASGSGYFVSQITLADVMFVTQISMMCIQLDNGKHPLLKAMDAAVTRHPKIAKWIKNRPVTEF